jgi:superfamily II DNA or RNA helicase/HKD family nuclease
MNRFIANIPGHLRMVDVLRNGLRTAHEIAFSVSFLRYSGLGLLIDELKDFSSRGGHARILTSTYLGITQPEALRSLANINGIECRVHVAGFCQLPTQKVTTGFHTKFYIFRNGGATCWVGSSNFTKGGLAANIEANLSHTAPESISAVEGVFDLLWSREDVIPLSLEFTNEYEVALRKYELQRTHPITPLFDPSRLSYSADNTLELPSLLPASHQGGEDLTPKPNDAQQEALGKLKELRASGEVRAAIIAATGVGKTFLAAFDAQECNSKSVLFLSHRLEHLSQAHRTFERVFKNRRTYGRVLQGVDQSDADFVFATVQSASDNEVLMRRRFDYVVIDEFHHADAPSYQKLIHSLSPGFMLGLTATPERQDGHDVLRLCDYNVAYEVRLVEAISRGWLLPFHYFGVSDVTVDYSTIPLRSGKFDFEKLENALMLQDRVDEILRHAQEKGFDGARRATVCFCAGVRHAKFMAQGLCQRGQTAIAVTAEQSSLEFREDVYRRFQDPQDPLEWLCVADVLNEGVDIPGINSILFLRPTESATVFIQQLGRGLRLTKDCEVLTVIDFVGHHRAAWLAIGALHDPDAGVTPSSIAELGFTPPKNCEVILDQRTLEILEKVRKFTESKKELCIKAYLVLRNESPRPYPLDLYGRQDTPDFAVFRSAFHSWIQLRRAADDAEPWELSLLEDSIAFRFLLAIERDWQQSRVYSYALAWGLCAFPEAEPTVGYNRFFDRFHRWKVEYKPLNETKAWNTLRKKLSEFFDGDHLIPAIYSSIPNGRLLQEVEGRIRLTLEVDFKLRHGGVLRGPEDLVLHRRYDRPEIVNHFGVQYDPARHNFGVITFGQNVVIITKLDTSSAMKKHHYVNAFVDEQTFAWQSQNQQRQDNQAGRLILDHQDSGHKLYLFVQPSSHEKAFFCGPVSILGVEGNAPMNVTFRLAHRLSPGVRDELLTG